MAHPVEQFEATLDQYYYLRTLLFPRTNSVILEHHGWADLRTQRTHPETTSVHVLGASRYRGFDEPGLLLRGTTRGNKLFYAPEETTQVKINPDLSVEVRIQKEVTPQTMLEILRAGFEVIDAYNNFYAPYYALENGQVFLGNLRCRRRFEGEIKNEDRTFSLPHFQEVLQALRQDQLALPTQSEG